MKHKGYILPEDPDPEDNFCFPVFIPKDDKYLIAFFGALDFFGKWLAWDDSGDGRAALAAARWKIANELTHTAFAAGGCVTTPQFRINPENCLLEVNCSDDPENPDWQDVPTAGTDPRDRVGQPPYPDPPPSGQTNECLAAANIAEFVWYAGDHLSERLGTGAVITEIVVAFAGILATFFQLLTSVILNETAILFINITPGTIDDDWDLLDKQDFIDLVVCYIEPDGRIPLSAWASFLAEVLALAGTNQAWYLVYYICALMGIGGMGSAALIGGITEADCAPCDADWYHVFDFEISDGDFEPLDDLPLVNGEYAGAAGWAYANLGAWGDGTFERNLYITRNTGEPDTTLTKCKLTTLVNDYVDIAADEHGFRLYGDGILQVDHLEDVNSSGTHTTEWVGSIPFNGVAPRGNFKKASTVYAKKLELWGEGVNPFA